MKVAVYAATMLLTLPWLPCTTGGNDPVLDSPFCQYTPKQCMQYVAAYHNVTDAEPASLWYERAGYSLRASPPELCRLVASSFRASEVKGALLNKGRLSLGRSHKHLLFVARLYPCWPRQVGRRTAH